MFDRLYDDQEANSAASTEGAGELVDHTRFSDLSKLVINSENACSHSPPLPTRKTVVKSKLLLACASSLLALVLCELVLRLGAGQIYPTPLYPGDRQIERDATFDPLIGWKLPPDAVLQEQHDEYSITIRGNRQGFRSAHDFDSPTPLKKLVFLGDSYTFGSGVEGGETFAAHLETRVADARSYNFGIGAFGVDQMWMTLRHYAMPLRPDVVVLSFIRYDLDRSLSAYRRDHIWRSKPTFQFDGDTLVPMTADDRPSAIRRSLHQELRLYRLWRKLENSLSRNYAVGYRWRLNRAIFEQIRDDCQEQNVPLLVVHIPINRRKPTPMFQREFADMGIEYLDLTPGLPTDADRLYFPRDRHLNVAGHRFAAEAILKRLIGLGWVEAATRLEAETN